MALGLILSSSDFTTGSLADPPWNSANNSGAHFLGGVTGSSQFNSVLTSPLTNAGDFSRNFKQNGVNRPYGFWNVSSSVDSGIYTGPYSTSKAYSLRAWIRKEDNAGDNRDSGIGLFARNIFDGTTLSIINSAEVYSAIPGGYTLQLSNRAAVGQVATSGRSSLWLQIRSPTLPNSVGITSIQCSGSTNNEYVLDTWHRVRMDVIPVGSSGDTINVYTSSAGDVTSGNEIWELVESQWVDSSDGYYVDPTNSNLQMGFYSFGQPGGENCYIDQFEILVQDI
jgi:hypothetical protein